MPSTSRAKWLKITAWAVAAIAIAVASGLYFLVRLTMSID
jgi:type VI protein secretion system component VasF